MKNFKGEFPEDLSDLQSIPGIGLTHRVRYLVLEWIKKQSLLMEI